jgi:hypothetical protein
MTVQLSRISPVSSSVRGLETYARERDIGVRLERPHDRSRALEQAGVELP